MSSVPFDEIVELALQLSPAEQARLMERLAAAMHDVLAGDENADETPWTDEEVADMMKIEPLTGGWADMDITDGAAWINEQKRKRYEAFHAFD